MRTVTREELRLKLWPADTFVDFEHSLNRSINKLREALGDHSENPRFIETLHRRGYRFIAPVDGAGHPAGSQNEQLPGPVDDATTNSSPVIAAAKQHRWWVAGGVFAGLILLGTEASVSIPSCIVLLPGLCRNSRSSRSRTRAKQSRQPFRPMADTWPA
ncbi:MAG: winged helix-turn-helix domain-containing protein [Candidatus Sulfotelmatobacter sp.]